MSTIATKYWGDTVAAANGLLITVLVVLAIVALLVFIIGRWR